MKNKTQKIIPPTKKEQYIIKFLIFIGVASSLNFSYWFFRPEYSTFPFLFTLLAITIVYGILRQFYMWYHYINISIPKTPKNTKTFTVDILTTYFPGEPYEMIEETLEAIQKITYPHTTYLCDEANDPYLIEQCKKLGVIHVTRTNRINAKAGNINNALQFATGEICVILDPDHIPEPSFLDPIIPHFSYEHIGFVQIVQSYYNVNESLVARGAAEQTFQFYGPMMMSMNTYGTVNAIGANCTFRRAALDSIGGHAPGLSEDMHTAMRLHAEGWKSVYIPEVLAKGLAPSDLTSFFKQQLKWSRGTFDLLFYVYPKLFNKFTTRQKIHYALLPLHYLVGITYLINFLIPILSLLLSKSPWTGNFLLFSCIILPMGASTILIRLYIQKWVIEKKERGFHIIGGLLQITTWWIYFLGFIYTIIQKKIPYIPTPKEGAEKTNLLITVPNIIIGSLSLFAIFYGLSVDLTPFSLLMAFFALLNAIFMFFGVYMAVKSTNKNRILRSNLSENTVSLLVKVKHSLQKISDLLYKTIRPIVPFLLVLVIAFTVYFATSFNEKKWDAIEANPVTDLTANYLGIFHPITDTGLSDMGAIDSIQKADKVSFDLISLYLSWGDKNKHPFPTKKLHAIYKNKSLPMITWEPWASDFEKNDTVAQKEKKILAAIGKGDYDSYIKEVALNIRSYNRPVFLRFAHEFDNPAYPWSSTGSNTPQEFIAAWKHIHHSFKQLGVKNVVWVWNPWKSEAMETYYPGKDYVDWIGITALNYGLANEDGKWYDFKSLYMPFHDQIIKLELKKPVILTEFGSLKIGGNQEEWTKNAFNTINDTLYQEIKGLILFNSSLDKNIPETYTASHSALDWSNSYISKINKVFPHSLFSYVLAPPAQPKTNKHPETLSKFPLKTIKGVQFKKGQHWYHNQYVLTKDVLEKDFSMMQKLGLNTIRIEGPNIYDYNILKYSTNYNLKVIYSFWVPYKTDFIGSKEKMELYKEEILNTVTKYKNKKNILAWNIGNENWNALKNSFNEPVLQYQRAAYLKWLSDLTIAIKDIDPNRTLTIDFSYSSDFTTYLEELEKFNVPFDYLGLVAKKPEQLQNFLDWKKNHELSYYISDIDPELYIEKKDRLTTNNVIFRNWQDQWESNKVTFDGLLDQKDRKKVIFERLASAGSSQEKSNPIANVKILLPSVLLYANSTASFTALKFINGTWQFPSSEEPATAYEWYLVKNDPYGNALATKFLGYGTKIQLTIPEEYQNYKLKLSYIQNGIVVSTISKLNTPLPGNTVLPK